MFIFGALVLFLVLWMVWQVQQQMQGLQTNTNSTAGIHQENSAHAVGWTQLPIPLPEGAIIKHWEATQQWIIWEIQVGNAPAYWLVYDLQAGRVRTQLTPTTRTEASR